MEELLVQQDLTNVTQLPTGVNMEQVELRPREVPAETVRGTEVPMCILEEVAHLARPKPE